MNKIRRDGVIFRIYGQRHAVDGHRFVEAVQNQKKVAKVQISFGLVRIDIQDFVEIGGRLFIFSHRLISDGNVVQNLWIFRLHFQGILKSLQGFVLVILGLKQKPETVVQRMTGLDFQGLFQQVLAFLKIAALHQQRTQITGRHQ